MTASSSNTPLRLLLVDDDEVDRMAVERAVRQGLPGAELIEACDATTALAHLDASVFDAVISDLHMPGRDGAWLIRMVRERGLDLPVVVLTGQGDEQTAVDTMKAGAADYLAKSSLSARRMEQVLRQAVRVHRAEREARAAVEALRTSEERLRLSLEVTGLGTWEWNPVTRLLTCDDRCRAILGRTEDPSLTFPTSLDEVHPDDREALARMAVESREAAEDRPFDVEFRVLTGPGQPERWVRSTGRTFFADGRVVRFVGTLLDITESKREQERARRRGELEQQLVGIVSHDLRNPISAMMMSASLLLKRVEASSPTTKALGRIVTSGERAIRLIRDLLDLTQARLGEGLPLEASHADIHPIVKQVADELALGYTDREIQLDAQGDGHGVWDTDRLAQLVGNLIGNALTYSPPTTPVVVRTRGTNECVTVEVHNQGAPIPPEMLPALFEPFKRGPDRRHDQNRSIGLGLFIVKEIVNAHQGRIEVRSSTDEGTTFLVTLPRARAA